MTERQLVSILYKQLKKDFPEHYWYKPGDTFGGHKKPSDILACINGKFVAIEFKKENGKLNDNQLESLNEIIRKGGIYLVGRFYGRELLIDGPAHKQATIEWKKGKYEKLEKLIDVVENFYK